MDRRLSFPENFRLKSKIDFDYVFQNGDSHFEYPFIIKYKIHNDDKEKAEIKTAFSCPKRKIKSSVDRNKIKRRMKEAYRLHFRSILSPHLSTKIVFIYAENKILSYSLIQIGIIKGIEYLSKILDRKK